MKHVKHYIKVRIILKKSIFWKSNAKVTIILYDFFSLQVVSYEKCQRTGRDESHIAVFEESFRN